jgi:hypothetical protein
LPAYDRNTKEVEDLAKQIIAQNRSNLSILKFTYVFRPEAAVTDGHVIAGMCVKVDDRNWSIHKSDFIIEIAKDVWEEASDEFKLAIVDHELGHAGIHMDEEGQPKMDERSGRIRTFCRRHDIEEFEDVLERHGLYHKGLRDFMSAFAVRKEREKRGRRSDPDPDET